MSNEFPENQPRKHVPDEDESGIDPSQDNEAILDNQTQALLDELDDEIDNDAASQDSATAELLQTLDQLKPQTLMPPDDEATDGVPDELQESTQPDAKVQARIDVSDEEISADDRHMLSDTGVATQDLSNGVADIIQEQVPISPPPPPAENAIQIAIDEPEQNYRYRITVSLPPLLQAAIEEALGEVGLIDEKPVGAFQWQAAFQCDQPQAIAASLDAWVQDNLPIPTKTERVHSAVIGTQTYIGGWKLSNSDAIYKAQEKLTSQLADIITPEADDDSTFRAILPVHNDVPANRFPQLIGHLQRRFKSETWKIEAVELLRLPLDKKGNPEVDATWNVMGTFRPEA